MMFKLLIFFSIFVVIVNSNRNPIRNSNILLNSENQVVNGLSQFEDKLLAVAWNNTINIYEYINSETLNLTQKYILEFEDILDFKYLVEFKLVSETRLLFCTFENCSICKLDSKKNEFYSLDSINANGLVNVKASLGENDQLIIRTIGYKRKTASIHSFKKGLNKATISTSMADPTTKGLSDFNVVASFTRKGYTYFVGNAKKIDIPFAFIGEGKRKVRNDLRISRICNLDSTIDFESRIDIALICDPLEDNYFSNERNDQIAYAATLSEDGKRLFVAFENQTTLETSLKNKSIGICEFEFLDVLKVFDKTWDDCQKIEDDRTVNSKCQLDILNTTDCYLVSWKREGSKPVCQPFNKDEHRILSNCALGDSIIKSDRNGWLENYKPVKGQLYNKFYSESNLTRIIENNNKDGLFAAFENGSISRIYKDGIFNLLIFSSNSSIMEINRAKQFLIYANKGQLKSIKIDCSNLYPKCEEIEWQDPLMCAWCADLDGNGQTIAKKSSNNFCKTGQLLQNRCPPKIMEVTNEKNKFTIIGQNFDRMENLAVFLLDKTGQQKSCNISNINYLQNTLIRCSSMFFKNPNKIQLVGRLGDLNSFTIQYTLHPIIDGNEQEIVEASSESKNHSRIVRIFASILIMIILLSLLVILWQLYRKYAVRIKNKVKQNSEKNLNKYKSVMSLEPNFIDEYDEQYIGTFGELDRSRILIVKYIGDGYSSKVHLAKYKLSSEDSRSVAVKTVNNTSFDHDDVMREIDLISKCSHKNIVEYIGHYSDPYGIHIVTEYMAGGDLHEYLIDENNKPLIGHAFLYILQICEAMEYLTKQHIVHRDLAARNCMLDEQHVVVKITDFGLCRTSNVDYEYISENHYQQLPFRWTAIECFGNNSKFSEKSDVWSFGVVVWEIFARNMQPYEGFDSRGVREFLKRGSRLEAIAFCPDELYQQVMLRCWDEVPTRRPTFTQLRVEIERIFWGMEKKYPKYLATEYETPINDSSIKTTFERPVEDVELDRGQITTIL